MRVVTGSKSGIQTLSNLSESAEVSEKGVVDCSEDVGEYYNLMAVFPSHEGEVYTHTSIYR